MVRQLSYERPKASAWLKFAMAFWDGSVAGGIIETVGLALASASAGSAAMTALKGTQVVLKLLAAMKGLVGAALNVAKAVILSAAKTAFKAATVVAAKLWGAVKTIGTMARSGVASAGDALRASFWALRQGMDGFALRTSKAIAERIDDFASWWKTTTSRISNAGSGTAREIETNIKLFLRIGSTNPAALGNEPGLVAMAQRVGGGIGDDVPKGLGHEAAKYAFSNWKRIQHGFNRFIWDNPQEAELMGFPSNAWASYRDAWRQTMYDITRYPDGTFADKLGGEAVTGYVGTVNEIRVVVFVYDEGLHKGFYATTVIPRTDQLRAAALAGLP